MAKGSRTVRRVQRDLDWDGCSNVRDLGGLPVAGGGTTRWGQVVRSDNPSRLTPTGWEALRSHGIGTVVTLRTIGTEDPDPDPAMVPSGVTLERVELEDATDPEFRRRCIDTNLWATPLEWTEMLRFWPDRCAAAITAIARAGPGGVVISCGIGRDRTGLVAFLLLALAGVPADAIAHDWSRSLPQLADDPLARDLEPMQILERNGMTVVGAVDAALAIDVESRLLESGLPAEDLNAVRTRLHY